MALSATLYLPSLFWTLGLDQNIFAEIGSLMLKGKKLYVDAWDVKPPNIFYIYALFEWIFGQHDFAVRISDYVFALFACAAIFAATERQSPLLAGHGREWVAPLASILLVLTLLSLGLADTAQTESYSLCFLIGASLLAQPFQKKRNYALALVAAGASIGVAAFFKTTNAVFLIAIAVEVWIYNAHPRWRSLLLLVTGFFAWSMLQIGMLALQGSLNEYFRITWSVFLHHPNEVSSLHFSDLLRTEWTYVDIWAIFAIVAIAFAIVRRDRLFLRATVSPLLLLGAGIAAVIIQNKGWGYQYVVILPGLVWLCALSAAYLYGIVHAYSRSLAVAGAIVIALATLFITPSARRRIHYISDAIESIHDHPGYLASLGSPKSLYYPPCTGLLARYLDAHSVPQDRVFIFGEEPGAYWRANRLPATRYVYSLLFTSGVISNNDILSMVDTLAWQKPAIIAIERFDSTAFRGKPETSESLLQEDTLFDGIRNLLSNNYRMRDTLCGNFILYRLHQ